MKDKQFPIIQVETVYGYILHGLLFTPQTQTKTIIIHMHGSAGNFYQSTFYSHLFELAHDMNIAFLSTNNRGTGVYDIETGTKSRGAAIELFEECLLDIDAWIEYVASLGYENILLQGHSFGTNKIQYYALNGKYKSKVKALILLGFTDSYGGQLQYLKKLNIDNNKILEEARTLVSEGKPMQLLSLPLINWGELPQTAESYLNFMSPNSVLSNILPLSKMSSLDRFKEIKIPILGIVGDHNEGTVIPPQAAVDMLNKENKNAQSYVIKNSNHTYKGKEKELVAIIKQFLIKNCKN